MCVYVCMYVYLSQQLPCVIKSLRYSFGKPTDCEKVKSLDETFDDRSGMALTVTYSFFHYAKKHFVINVIQFDNTSLLSNYKIVFVLLRNFRPQL